MRTGAAIFWTLFLLAPSLACTNGDGLASAVLNVDAQTIIDTVTFQNRYSNECVGLDAAVRAHTCKSGWTSQRWHLNRVNTEVYQLINQHQDLCLSADGSNLRVDRCGSSDSRQLWTLVQLDSLNYSIRSRETDQCVSNVDGAIGLADCQDNYWTQNWAMRKAGGQTYSWSPGIDSSCHSFAASEEEGWLRWPEDARLNSDCRDAALTAYPSNWHFSGTNEDEHFSGGVMWGVPEGLITHGNGNLYNYAFHQKSDGNYQIGMSLDKMNFLDFEDRHTFIGINDSFDVNRVERRPDMSEELWVDVRLGLFGESRRQSTDPEVGLGMSRVMVGASLRSDTGRVYFVEVVLWRHQEYDLCNATMNLGGPHPREELCESGNLYDRRSGWFNGESLYYNADALKPLLGFGLPSLQHLPLGQMASYKIPIAELFRAYDWDQVPADLSKVTVSGIYLGIETWGQGWAWIEFDDYRLYSTGQN